MINITATMSLLELLVIAFGIPGIVFSSILIFIFQKDRKAVKRAGLNGINKRMTTADMRNELGALYQLLVFVGLGAILSLVASSPRASGQFMTPAEMISVLLISCETKETILSIWRFVDRRKNAKSLRALAEAVAKQKGTNEQSAASTHIQEV